MSFAQVIIGPPGCGKTTYCYGLSQLFTSIERPFAIVNLDPANDGIPYKADIDIAELINLEEIMDEYKLGPNGGLIYCMEYLEANMDWLFERLETVKGKYVLFDCPGQIELFTNNMALKNIIDLLQKADYRICVVNLIDSHYCIEPAKYVSMLMVSLKTMLQLGCAQINVLSKIDLLKSYGTLDFSLDYYTEVQDLSYLLERLNRDPLTRKFQKISAALCELVEEFGIVGFMTLCIEDKESVLHVIRAIDKANGFIFGGLDKGNESLFETANRWDAWDRYNRDVEDKYLVPSDHHAYEVDDDDLKDALIGEIKERNNPAS